MLEAYPWPGNIRQLENVMQQSVLTSSGHELLLSHLPQPILEYMESGRSPSLPTKASSLQNREEGERNAIRQTLMRCGYARARPRP
jgi:DNA-binding NtrC family response regulator